MSEVGTKGFFGKALPPFLLKIEAHNNAYNAAISARTAQRLCVVAWFGAYLHRRVHDAVHALAQVLREEH